MMELVTTIANIRGMSERQVVNTFTHRQINHIGETYLRDRTLVMNLVGEALSGIGEEKGKIEVGADEAKKLSRASAGRLPTWFMPKNKGPVVDLDGPMSSIKPFVGGYGKTEQTGKKKPKKKKKKPKPKKG